MNPFKWNPGIPPPPASPPGQQPPPQPTFNWAAFFFLTLLAVVVGILVADYIWTWLMAQGLKNAFGG